MIIMHLLNNFFILVTLPTLIKTLEPISLNEETPAGTIVFDLNELSNLSIKYELLESSEFLSFDSTTNRIAIAKRIDRDTQCINDDSCSKCNIKLKLFDLLHRKSLVLKFNINDINDNSPTFSSNAYSISLAENNIPGTKIRLSKAEDIDCEFNGVQLYELTYFFHGNIMMSSINLLRQQNQTINQPFYLLYDSDSELYLVINQTLDRELQSDYVFTITANDYSHAASAKITLTVLDVNDHIARFSQSTYSVNVSHATPAGTVLIKLTAYDPDLDHNGYIYYSLLSIDGSINRNDLFQINYHTGELRLIGHLNQIDSKRTYKLIVGASDGSNNAIPTLATVYVNVIQQSTISVTFGSNRVSKNLTDVFIEENLPNATFIAYVTSDENLQIFPESDDNRGFYIKKLSDNSLTLLTDRSYDRESRSSYDVLIRSGKNQRSFRILVTDVNDCRPQWNSSLLNINVENRLMILTLTAIDNDEKQNGKVSYRKYGPIWPLWTDLVDNKLIINCTNDTVNTCWYDLLNDSMKIRVEAYDHGKPELSSVIEIRLYNSGGRLSKQFEYILASSIGLLGILLILLMLCLCMCCRKKSKIITKQTVDDHSTQQKIIQISSSEQSSSADSLYGSEKSDNITLETAASCHLDMFLFSPKRGIILTDSPYQYSFVNKSTNLADNLTNKLFNSIQNDLTLLTDTKQDTTPNRGTYV